jgi:hypothetical protein
MTGIAAAASQYKDMRAEDYWSYNALNAAVDNGLFQGDEKGNLNPSANITRAEAAKVIASSFGANEKATIDFIDVSADEWFYNWVAIAVEMGVFTGNDDGTFTPNSYITREQAFTVLARALEISGKDSTALNKFSDAGNVSDYAKGYLAGMLSRGYLKGYDNNTIKPKAYITREEFANILYNIFNVNYISKPGTYSGTYTGDVIISVPGVTLKDSAISGDLVIADGVGAGDVIIDNVDIKGGMIVRGGGENSVTLKGKTKISVAVTVVVTNTVTGTTRINNVSENPVPNVINTASNGTLRLEGNGGFGTVQTSVDTKVEINQTTVTTLEVQASVTTQTTVKVSNSTVTTIAALETSTGTTASETTAASITVENTVVQKTFIQAQNTNLNITGTSTVQAVTVVEAAVSTTVNVEQKATVKTATTAAASTTLNVSGTVSTVNVASTATNVVTTVAATATVSNVVVAKGGTTTLVADDATAKTVLSKVKVTATVETAVTVTTTSVYTAEKKLEEAKKSGDEAAIKAAETNLKTAETSSATIITEIKTVVKVTIEVEIEVEVEEYSPISPIPQPESKPEDSKKDENSPGPGPVTTTYTVNVSFKNGDNDTTPVTGTYTSTSSSATLATAIGDIVSNATFESGLSAKFDNGLGAVYDELVRIYKSGTSSTLLQNADEILALYRTFSEASGNTMTLAKVLSPNSYVETINGTGTGTYSASFYGTFTLTVSITPSATQNKYYVAVTLAKGSSSIYKEMEVAAGYRVRTALLEILTDNMTEYKTLFTGSGYSLSGSLDALLEIYSVFSSSIDGEFEKTFNDLKAARGKFDVAAGSNITLDELIADGVTIGSLRGKTYEVKNTANNIILTITIS